MSKIEFYVLEKGGMRRVLEKGVLAVELAKAGNTIETFEQRMKGFWEPHSMVVKDPFLEEDDLRVRDKQQERDKETGERVRNLGRFKGCLIEVAVSKWTLEHEPTEAGFALLPRWIGEPVAALVIDRCYSDGDDDPDFLDLLSPKQDDLSPETKSGAKSDPGSKSGGSGEPTPPADI